MKKMIYLSVTAFIFLNIYLFAYNTITVDDLKKNLAGNNSNRTSGKGIFIHTIYKRAVSQEEVLKGKEFQDDQQKQAYLNHIRSEAGLDFSLKQDKLTYKIEKLQFDQNKMLREYAELSETMANNILNDPNEIKNIDMKTFLYDGQTTTSLQTLPKPGGGTVTYATIEGVKKIYFPKFNNFGRTTDEDVKMLVDLKGAVIHQSEINKQIHTDLEAANGMVKMKWILDPDKGMSISYVGFYANNQLKEDSICGNFTKIAGGEWYPQKHVSNKYVAINGEEVLISMEMFEAIPDSVNFNVSIDPSIFSPKFPDGTEVTDFRKDPAVFYITGVSK
jgi:hypothetical protein